MIVPVPPLVAEGNNPPRGSDWSSNEEDPGRLAMNELSGENVGAEEDNCIDGCACNIDCWLLKLLPLPPRGVVFSSYVIDFIVKLLGARLSSDVGCGGESGVPNRELKGWDESCNNDD